MAEVICLGEALIDFVALESGVSLMEATGFKKAAGGAPANVAAGLAKLGISSAFIGKVGEDPFGHYLEQMISDAGVNTSGMLFERSARTGLAFVSLTSSGERDFVFYRHPSADMLLTPAELKTDLFSSARVFHYGSLSMISEPSRSATLRAQELAREQGLLISCDPNLRLSLWNSEQEARDGLFLTLKGAELIKISEEELEFLFSDPDLQSGSLRLLDSGAKLVFITMGTKGCFFNNASSQGRIPAFQVPTLDTTGAGDGFMAGILTQLLLRKVRPADLGTLDEKDLSEIGRFANAVGALTTTKKGAIPSLPSLPEVETFLKEDRSLYS